ncbi:MAG TPA: hypothetical protein VFO94_19190 [Gammaproteobacteria bacterium]|nr:hypothetical protein [Gammaproteobacteria bacterium]
MKTAFIVAVLLGFSGVLAAAHFVPWMGHARLPSQTEVVATGGRAEQFLIRLPVDRIGASGAAASPLRTSRGSASTALPAELDSKQLLVEHFKVRDAAGNVIGVAARHWSSDGRGMGTAWSVLIPSRGAMLLTAPGDAKTALDGALQKAGYRPGTAWSGVASAVAVELTPRDGGEVAAGSDEFEQLDGSYREIWKVTGVSETGELRGTIELDTVTRRGS